VRTRLEEFGLFGDVFIFVAGDDAGCGEKRSPIRSIFLGRSSLGGVLSGCAEVVKALLEAFVGNCVVEGKVAPDAELATPGLVL
jgi:hypothetical protein